MTEPTIIVVGLAMFVMGYLLGCRVGHREGMIDGDLKGFRRGFELAGNRSVAELARRATEYGRAFH
jgi:hypothetical protein